MDFVDRMEIAGTRRRAEDGALLVDARVARTGIQIYSGHEVGKPHMSTVRVYRDEAEVFAKDSLVSYAHRPVTNDHPPEPVTVDNWRKYAVGGSGETVARDGDMVRVPMMVSDAAAIKDIEDGKREISMGYSCDLDWTAGTTPSGETFDAQQRKIRPNHIAIVDRARGGSNLRIGDHQPWGISPVIVKDAPKMAKMIFIDGMPIDISDTTAAETVITTLQKKISDGVAKIGELQTAHVAALADKDKQIGTLTAELKTAKDSAPKPADIQKMVADRAVILGIAGKMISDFKPESIVDKSNADIRKMIVAAKLGDDAVKDATDAKIEGMFDVLTRDGTSNSGTADPFRQMTLHQDGANGDKRRTGYTSMVDKMTKQWQDAKPN